MEPLNKGHVGTSSFVPYREVFFIRMLKCTGIIGIGTSRFVLYGEVFFIRSVLYQRFHCIISYTILVNKRDNCPHVSNQDQTDVDANGVGDACEGCKSDKNNDKHESHV